MFTPKRMPKEGRSLPGLPYAGSSSPTRGRRLNQRQGLLIIVIVLCIPLLYYITSSSDSITPVVPGADKSSNGAKTGDRLVNLDGQKKPVTEGKTTNPVSIPDIIQDDAPAPIKPVSKPKAEDSDKEKAKEAPAKKPAKKPVVEDDEEDEPVVKRPKPGPSEALKKHKAGPNAEKWAERPDFERALDKIVDIMPDEVQLRELTRPIEVTGKDRLREFGLRTRQYKKYFDAWEKLHLVEDDEGSVYIRDDVVQYLRSHQHDAGLKGSSADGGLAGKSIAETIRVYESYRHFLIKYAELLFPWTMPYFSDHMSLHAHFKKGGRGIVLTAGDDQAPYLLTTIWTFRKLGCNLPIEVMYLGDNDLGEDYRLELEAMDGVITRDVAQMVNDQGWKLAGWAAKPFAILLSSFREVIFIDADSLFFRDPETLFEEKGYKDTGALFFKDRLIMPESKRRWLQQILPNPIPRKAKQSRFWTGESGHMQESGVVVVDKWRHFIPLLLVTRMNGPDRDGNKERGIVGVYDMVYGDKETFWVAWLLAGTEDFHFHEGDAGIMGLVKDPEDQTRTPRYHDPDHPDASQHPFSVADHKADNYTICAPQLLHMDLEGRPYWFNGWLLDNKFAERGKKRFAEFQNYLVEPRDVREPGSWQLAESNMCCLTSDPPDVHEFTAQDRATIKMIMDRAREKKAFGNQ